MQRLLLCMLVACGGERAVPTPTKPGDATVAVVDPSVCPPGTTRRERDVADPAADDQVMRHEIACVLPDGTLHGPYELRFGDSITSRGVYDHGKRTGRWIDLGSPQGSYREGVYVDDQQDGVWKSFHAAGKLAWHGAFKRGKRHGHFEWFRPDGTKQQAGELVEDRQDGTWTFYRADGSLERTEVWSNGRRVR